MSKSAKKNESDSKERSAKDQGMKSKQNQSVKSDSEAKSSSAKSSHDKGTVAEKSQVKIKKDAAVSPEVKSQSESPAKSQIKSQTKAETKSETDTKPSATKDSPNPKSATTAATSGAPTPGASKFGREKWDFSSAEKDDSLLACLETLTHLLGKPTSASALKAGLPLEKGLLTPMLFGRAAARASLSSKLVHKKLVEISKFTLPCVLTLKGDKACLLVDADHEKNAYEVVFPETGRGSVVLTGDDLAELYTGVAIFVKEMYKYDQRSIDLEVHKPREWFWGTLKKSWPIYIQVGIAAILINLFAAASPIFTMNVYDRVVPNSAIETLWVLAIGILFVFVFDFILKSLRVYFVDTAGKKADVLLGSRIFETIMKMQLSSRPMSSGGFANEVREFETLRDFFSSATLVGFIDLPFIFFFLLIVYWIGGPIVWVPLVAVPLILIGAILIHTPLTNWVRQTFREGAQKHALLVEAINGLETIKSFGAEGRMQRNWERFVAESSESSKSLKFFAALAMNYSALIQQLSYIGVVIVGVYLISEGTLTMGALIASSILSARALAPLAQMVSLLTRFNHSMIALKALDGIIQLPSERPPNKTFLHRPKLDGQIEYRSIDFSYPGQDDLALRDFSMKVEAGEKLALLGRIGSGKSTIERLTLGLYEPQKGSVIIDGTDIRQIDPADLRNNIGYAPQDIYLFFGTVRENITFGSRDIDEESFMRAAEISGVLDFVRHHPQGFDMPVGEGGTMLSGGQRQAIAIARALVRDPAIFIMDEPTAMMDNASEARLASRLNEYLKDKTFILITHRVPLLRLVDRLVVMDGGRLVADGPKDKIMEMLNKSQIRTAK